MYALPLGSVTWFYTQTMCLETSLH